jgi:hypothetical protein
LEEDLDGGGGGPQWQWRRIWRRSEAHGVNLDDGRIGGVDLDDGHVVEAHTEEERGTDVEADGAASRRMWRRSRRRWVCGEEMIGFGFRDSGTLKKNNSSDERG